ncbi:MAG TPA: hypothetical protein VHD84_01880 [Candidatus Saccharimonadales bacterium]|nr:hypothetical protein [Candidatus Saccharimonadales bacterium]
MEEQLSEENVRQIRIIYIQLEGLWNGLEGRTGDTVAGPLTQFEEALNQLEQITAGDYDHYMPDTKTVAGDKKACSTQDLHTQISGLLGNLRASYFPEQSPHYSRESERYLLSVNQSVNQEVNVTQNLIIDIAVKLERLENEYAEGSPERNFITRLKDGLKGVKDVAQLIGLLATSAQAVSLDVDKLVHILRALNLA